MIRLLTATMLVASFSVVADTEVTHTFEEGEVIKAEEFNENFDALEAAIDAIPADAITAVTAADLDMAGKRVLFSNVYSRFADLPSASANHGMFAHVHETGEAYYAHAGDWIQIAKQSSIDGASATDPVSALTCTTNQIIKYDGNEWVCAAIPADGAKGDTGDKGDKGDTGDQGIQGIQGTAGTNGTNGTDGTAGADGVAAGLSCNTNQIIRNNGSEWVCVNDPFANSCAAGDALRYDGAKWVCTTSSVTGYLRTENFTLGQATAASLFTSVSSTINVTSYCYTSPDSCYIALEDVSNYTACFSSVDTNGFAEPMVENGPTYVLLSNLNALAPGQRLNIDITCLL